ncbi:proline-, glutamic acid- and leucine-rich protein 1 [Scleropages formosus]|uniref:Proline-, glutamic acid- and leucine-rich protein 1 n=1 Tax=Scleropages formosus TaxID=113540 RepID=A0A8C9V200_SCLFO|nr:proline-, glutamic acid- and leucine-rich protein 1 [Scleropages formosus]
MATAALLHGSTNMRLTEGLVSALKLERPEYLPSLLANYREHGGVSAQSSAAVSGLIGLSNGQLSSSKTRFEGLCLLAVLVRDSSSEVFQQHCLTWLRLLQQVIQSQAPLPSIQLAIVVLQDLLQYSSQLPELAREVGLNSILGILTSLLGLKLECHLVAMEGMKACMTFYPRACGSLKDKLGAYFLSKMDSDNPRVQEVACECFGRLPCLGGVLERGGGSRRAEGWASQVHCLLATAHSLLGQMYQGAESEGAVQYEGPGMELPLPPLEEADPLLMLQLPQRYRAVCLALTQTLSMDPNSPVSLPVQSVLNLVCRALAVSCKNINTSGDGCFKLLFLPSVHSDTLEVLSTLITVAGSRLLQYSNVLSRLFSQTLSAWSPPPEGSPGQQRAFSAVKVCLYRTLELWVRVAGASAGILHGSPTHNELLLTHLLGDITPGPDSVKLRAGQPAVSELVGHGGKAAAAAARRAKGMGDVTGVSIQRKGDALANQDTCVSALRALRQIILSCGTLLKEDIHKRLQDLVLPLCVRLQQQPCGSDVGTGSSQYGSAPPRRELYRLLLALVLTPPPRWPPPLPCAVSIFSHGRRDHSLTVASFCTEALAICNSLLHPRVPSIALPLPPLALKHTPAAPNLTPSQNPSLSLPTLLGGPTQASPFPARHPLGLGPPSLLAPMENHLPLPTPVLPPQAGSTPAPGELLSPPQPGELAALGPNEGRRPLFVRYEKEEAEDVEISLESDSDDSVVIVPPDMLMQETQEPAGTQPIHPPPGGAVPGLTVSAASETGAVNSPIPNELPTTMALPSNSNAVTTFPAQSQTQLVSLVPPLSSGATQLAAPSVSLGDSLPGTQLQQMLLQSSPAGQASQLGLPVQIQLQTQLAQPSRQPQPQQMTNEEDLTVININSSDEEEDEEEEMDDDEIGEEEEEEEDEPLDDEEEEEEGSEFAEEYYDGEEFGDYEEEEEEEEMIEGEDEEGMIEGEEEEEEAEELPALETGEGRRLLLSVEEEAVGSGGEGTMEIFCGEEGGESQGTGRETEEQPRSYGQDSVQEDVKQADERAAGVLEEQGDKLVDVERESEALQDGKTDSQPHGAAGDSSQEADITQGEGTVVDGPEVTSKEQEAAQEEDAPTVDETAASLQEPMTESPEDVGKVDEKAGERPSVDQPPVELREESKEQLKQGQQMLAGQGGTVGLGEEREDDAAEENVDDLRSMKRKREINEEGEGEGEVRPSVEKKKLDEEAMASMLADFVDCPPDEEENARSPAQSEG